jgi:hypothetical protein
MAVGYSAGGLLTLFTFGVVRSSAYFLPAQKVRTETPRLFQYDPKALLYQEQEKLIILRGEYEGNLMKGHATALQPTKVTVAGSGFGSKNNIKSHAKELARVLQTEGIIRVDHVLPTSTADELRTYLYELRMQSETLVQQGAIESIERFADVLLKTNRCDLTVPLESNLVATALNHVLRKSPVGELLKLLLSEKAILYELSCLMSDAGSQRQVMHPDTPWIEGKDASLYTCFIALQDIHEDMGPYVFVRVLIWLLTARARTNSPFVSFLQNYVDAGDTYTRASRTFPGRNTARTRQSKSQRSFASNESSSAWRTAQWMLRDF